MTPYIFSSCEARDLVLGTFEPLIVAAKAEASRADAGTAVRGLLLRDVRTLMFARDALLGAFGFDPIGNDELGDIPNVGVVA